MSEAYLRKRLDSLPMGNRPWTAYSIRAKFLNDLMDNEGIENEEERRLIKENLIGFEPPDVDRSNTVGGWWDRTVTDMGYNTAIQFNQIRQVANDLLQDPQERDEIFRYITTLKGEQAQIPAEQSTLGQVSRDVIASSPTTLAPMAVGAGLSLIPGVNLVSGTLLTLGVNPILEGASAYDENRRNEEIDARLKGIYGDNQQAIDEAKLVIAREAGQAIASQNVLSPTNLLTAIASQTPMGRIGKAFLFRTPTTKIGKAFPNVRDVAIRGGAVAGAEGVEEGAQDFLQQAETAYQIQKLDTDPEGEAPDRFNSSIIKDIDYGRVAYAGGLGAISGGAFGTVRAGVNRMRDLPRENLRQEIRDAIESGNLSQFEAIRDRHKLGTAERVVVEQEIKDINEGVVTDYRVDKDKTRYQLRTSLGKAMAEGQQAVEQWIKMHRDNPLASDAMDTIMADLDARRRMQEDSARVASPFYPPAISPRDFRMGSEFSTLLSPQSKEGAETEQGIDASAERARRRAEADLGRTAEEVMGESARVRSGTALPYPDSQKQVVPFEGFQTVGEPYTPLDQATRTARQRGPEARQEPEAESEFFPPTVTEDTTVDINELRRQRRRQQEREQEGARGAQRRMEADMLRDRYDDDQSFRNYVNNLISERRSSDVRQEDETQKQGRSQKDDGQKADAEEVVKPKSKPKAKPVKKTKVDQTGQKAGQQPSAKTETTSRTKRKQPSKKTSATAEPAPVQEVRPLGGPLTERADNLRRNQNISRFDMQRDGDGNITETTFYDNKGAIDKLTRDELEQEGMIRKVAGKESIDLTTKQPAPVTKTETVQEQDDTKRTTTEEDTAKKVEESAPEAEKQDAKPSRTRKKEPSTPKEPEAVVEEKVEEGAKELKKETEDKKDDDKSDLKGWERNVREIRKKLSAIYQSNGVRPVEMRLENGLTSPVVEVNGRTVVLLEINQDIYGDKSKKDFKIVVPFYLSSGMGGKKNVKSGQFYPILGISPEGWFNKGTQAEINAYYNSPALKRISELLNDTSKTNKLTDVIAPQVDTDSGVKALSKLFAKGLGFEPVSNGKKDTRAKLKKNIEKLRSIIDPVVDKLPPKKSEGGIDAGKKKKEIKAEETKSLVPPKKSARPKKRIVPAKASEQKADPSRLQDTDEQVTERTTGFTEEGEAEVAVQQVETQFDETADNRLVAYTDSDGKQQNIFGFTNNKQVSALKNARNDGVVRTVEDIKNLTMQKGTEKRAEDYIAYNKKSGKSADLPPTVAEKIIDYADKELGVRIPVIGIQDEKLEFTYGDQYIGNIFRNYLGVNAFTDLVKAGKLEDEVIDIVKVASFQQDGQPSLSSISRKDYPVKGSPAFAEFEDMIKDIKNIGVRDAYIDVNTGVFGRSEFDKFLPEDFIERITPEGIPVMQTSEAGTRTLTIVLTQQDKFQGINNNKPVDVIYKINFKPEGGKAIKTKKLQEFAKALIQPSFRTQATIDVRTLSRAPSQDVGRGISSAQVVQELARFSQRFAGSRMLKYKIFDSTEDAQQAGYNIKPNARGAIIDDETVLLISENIADLNTARAVLFHESIGHYGMKQFLGERGFNQLLDEIISKRKLDVDRKAKELGVDRRIATEELIAEIAEGRANQNVAQRILQIIKDFFSRVFGREMSDAEIRNIVIQAEKKFRDNPRVASDPRYDDTFTPKPVTEEQASTIFPEANSIRYSLGTSSARLSNKESLNLEIAREQVSEYMMTRLNGKIIQPYEWDTDYAKNDQNRINMIKASDWSRENRERLGGWYMLRDGGWRFEIPDYDKDGNPILQINKNFLNKSLEKEFEPINRSVEDLLQLHRTGEMSKYRDEIEDYELMKFNARDGEFELLDIIRHKELEERYPELMKNHRVVFTKNLRGLGGYNEMGQTIYINSETVHVGPKSQFTDSLRSVILHELTHAIQDFSGYANGANADSNFDTFDHKRADALTHAYTEDWQQLNAIKSTSGVITLGEVVYRHFQNAIRKKKSPSKVLRDAYDNILNRNPRFLAYFSRDSKFLDETLTELYENIERKYDPDNLALNEDFLIVGEGFTVKVGDSEFTFSNEVDIKDLLDEFFSQAEQSRLDLELLMPETFNQMAQYRRNLGEMEARDQQYRFATSNVLELKKAPLQFLYEHDKENISNQDQAILMYVEDQRESFIKEYTPEMRQVRYSIAPDADRPIISRRQQSSTAPSWMSEEQARVFNIPQFGNPLAGQTFKSKLEFMFHDIGMKLRQGIFDRFASLKRLSDKAYILARMSNSSDGALDALFRYGTISMDEDGAITVDPNSKSLVEALSPLGNDLDVFLRWVASQRHRDLKNDPKTPRDALQFLSDAEMETALTFNQGQTVNALTGESVSREKLFDDVYKDFKAIQNSVTEIARKSGLIDDETAKIWENQFYVPFYRLLEEDGQSGAGPRTLDGLVNQRAYQKLKGSDKHLGDLLQNTLMNWNHLISASLKNNAGKQAIKEMLDLPTPMAVGPESFPAKRMFDQEIVPDGGQIVHVMEEGKRAYYYIEDPLYLESLQALNQIGRDNPFFKLMRGSKRWFTYSVTFSPEFKIANLLRDSINSIAVTGTDINPFANVYRGWKGSEKDAKTQAFLTAGGGMFQFGAMNGTDPDVAKRMIQAGINKEFVLDSPEGFSNFNRLQKMSFQAGKRLWGATIEKYDKLGNRLENVNRIALYDKLREQGMSHLEASYNARDLMDFSSTGSFGMIQYLASFSPFLNARLQGLYKLGRAGADPAQRMRLITTLGAYVMASTALYLMYKDDPDFESREEWDRDTYHWFKMPFTDVAFRIPKAFELGVIATLVERGVEQFVDDDVHGKLFADRLLHALEGTLAFDVRPALFRPFMDIYSNKNPFTDRPIESLSMQNLSPEERRNAYTSEFSTLLSQSVHSVIPWDAVTYSPVQIQYLVNGFGGWIGSTVLSGADVITRVAQGKSALPTGFQITRAPVVKRFVDDPERRVSSKFNTQFYYMQREMGRVFNDMRELRELGEIERAQSIQEKKKLMLQYRKGFNRVQRRASEINNEIARIRSDPNMDTDLKDMRTNRLTQLRNAMLRAVVEQTPPEIRY